MNKLIRGAQRFRAYVFGPQRAFFEGLAGGQCPLALFITCSDSRVDPNLLTGAGPGELFTLRNAGNLVPPDGGGGEGATVEYAVAALGVRDLIVCGHSGCGAMQALLRPEQLAGLPAVAGWLAHAEGTRRALRSLPPLRGPGALLTAAVEANVLVQLGNLRTHPAVAAGLDRGELRLHGWVYRIETGEVLAHDPRSGRFVPLAEHAPEQTVACIG